MPIQFPSNPQTNQEYTYEGKVWAWDGVSWVGVRQETGVKKQNIWAKQNLLIPKRSTGLNSGYSGVTDQRRTQAGTIPALKHYMERDLGEFNSLPLWTPSLITTSLWLDADDANTITLNGNNVSQWNDKSGNARNATQGLVANQPVYNTLTLNSKPAITFDGTLKFLEMSVNISNIILSNSYSAFTVGRATSAPTNNADGFNNSGFWGDNGGYISNYFRGTSNLIGVYNWDGTNDVTTQSYTFGTNVISGVELSGGSIRLRQNGGTETSTASGNTQVTTGVLRIGKVYRDQEPNFTGVVSEVIFCRGHLSTTDRQLVEGYLAWKWGLEANLPNDHPYKNAAPTE